MAKLRHIAITVPDPERAAEFYMRAFGLERVGSTDWEGAHGVYLSDGVMNIALLHYRKQQYAGARGWCVSTHLEDGTWTHVFHLTFDR